jgi:hypothetical protein
MASYVYSVTKGTIDNWGSTDDIGYGGGEDPNYWINRDGHTLGDYNHLVKIQGTYILPFDISFNAYFHVTSNDRWNMRLRTSRSATDQGRVTFNAEPWGDRHYPLSKTLDLRIEKIFKIASKYRLGFIFDVFNVFNDSTITSWGDRIGYDWYADDPTYAPSTQGHDLSTLVLPRRARVGIRLIF